MIDASSEVPQLSNVCEWRRHLQTLLRTERHCAISQYMSVRDAFIPFVFGYQLPFATTGGKNGISVSTNKARAVREDRGTTRGRCSQPAEQVGHCKLICMRQNVATVLLCHKRNAPLPWHINDATSKLHARHRLNQIENVPYRLWLCISAYDGSECQTTSAALRRSTISLSTCLYDRHMRLWYTLKKGCIKTEKQVALGHYASETSCMRNQSNYFLAPHHLLDGLRRS